MEWIKTPISQENYKKAEKWYIENLKSGYKNNDICKFCGGKIPKDKFICCSDECQKKLNKLIKERRKAGNVCLNCGDPLPLKRYDKEYCDECSARVICSFYASDKIGRSLHG